MPVLGTSLAVTYAVGYYYGIDIRYFTLFSVGEHVVSAIEFLPKALSIGVVPMLLALALDYVPPNRNRGIKRAGWISIFMLDKATPLSGNQYFWYSVGFFVWSMLMFWRNPATYGLSGIALSLVFIICWLTLNQPSFSARAVPVAVSSVLLAFAYGFDAGSHYRQSDAYGYTVSTERAELRARIVRSGERGLLFFQAPLNNLRFLPWSEIKGLSSDSDIPGSGRV